METTFATIATPFGGGTTIHMQRADKTIADASTSSIGALCSVADDES
jgi:hypothetical protein